MLILTFRPSEAFPIERTESNTHASNIYNPPKSVREGVTPPHTPGVYTTPVSIHFCNVFEWDLNFRRSNVQKQSINDA